MKYSLVLIALIVTSFANAETFCSSEVNGEGDLLSLKGRKISLAALKVGTKVLFDSKPVKIVEFYTTGGPEEGLTVITKEGKKFDIWCTDENTPTDN